MIVSVDGADLFYETRGTGYPCIVPSILGTTVFERLLPPPLTDAFRFACVDLRGGGRSTGDPASLTFDVLARDLDAVRLHLGASRVAVLGYSIVGVVALEYGRRFPETVSHVIMAGTPPAADLQALVRASTMFFASDGSPERKAVLAENMARLPAGTPPAQAVFAQTPMRFFDPGVDAAALFADAQFNARLVAHVLGPLTARLNVLDGVESLRVPTLLAHGRHDYTVPYTMWTDVIDRVPNATLHLFERSGHQAFYEEPVLFAQVVRTWMATTEAATARDVRR